MESAIKLGTPVLVPLGHVISVYDIQRFNQCPWLINFINARNIRFLIELKEELWRHEIVLTRQKENGLVIVFPNEKLYSWWVMSWT